MYCEPHQKFSTWLIPVMVEMFILRSVRLCRMQRSVRSCVCMCLCVSCVSHLFWTPDPLFWFSAFRRIHPPGSHRREKSERKRKVLTVFPPLSSAVFNCPTAVLIAQHGRATPFPRRLSIYIHICGVCVCQIKQNTRRVPGACCRE